MANPYQANIESEDGTVRIGGYVNFTDPENQPGGGGGGYTYTGDGSPLGVQAAAAIGNSYLDSTNGAIYFATAAGTDGWVLVAGNSPSATDSGVFSEPGSAFLGDGTVANVGTSGGNPSLNYAAEGGSVTVRNYAGDVQLQIFDVAGTPHMAFFNEAGGAQQVSGGTLDGVIAGLVALGLFAS
jgi:hypothetical protein